MAAAIPSAEETIGPPLPAVDWIQTSELGYLENRPKQQPVCFYCRKAEDNLSKCSKCGVASYCSRDHQVADWKAGMGHKHCCKYYKRAGLDMTLKTEKDRSDARTELFGRIRFYVCPYAVHRQVELGKGFLFVQSECTLAEISLPKPQNATGHHMGMRSVLIHFLTVGEFDSEVCRDDFELAEFRSRLHDAVDQYDKKTQVALLMRFRCGHLALGLAALVPDYGICKSLGKDYYSNSTAGALQLNIDDV
eukprot:CAMPEP_0202467038 /NCGR_PEP_ID=MMETSP1360-20130828/70705_1 /ASSEMBLY_ACC=CAM_ASM_000848 /TAXON_ID=515479 /ORGANISM="Licmophora paradoxa, Strain CCMP2313" /LENGTH=248 /DNA_ID=CAMNT_0049091389 /DNA_START=1 /DNA_END=747 /DNA_ORIENTATION=+